MIDVDPLVEQELQGDYTSAHLVTFFLNGATLRYTENGHDIEYGGETYISNGLLIAMGEPKYTSQLRVNEVEISLSGADLTTIALFLNNPQYNRRVIVNRAYLDDDGDVIGEPIVLNNFRVIGWGVDDDHEGESIVAIKMASEFADWEKPSGRRTSEASQQRFFSADRGFEFAASVQKELRWGGA